MLRLLNNFFIIFLCISFFASCDYIDFSNFINIKPIEIKIEPENNNSILPDIYSPVILKFNTKMEKRETENLLQISSDFGIVTGDKFWENNDLYFVPVSGWIPGIRYNLNLLGSIRSADGREIRIEQFISFYAINRNNPPILEYHYPVNGESIGTNNPVFEFHFSNSMNKLSVENAITIEGIGSKNFEWEENDRILKIIPEKALSPWNYYRWTLKDSAKCINGIPLPKTYYGNFTTDLDHTLPFVEKVFPVLFSDGCWYPTGAEIETGLRQGHGIAVSFNKPMSENVIRAIRFEPSLSGRTELLTENSIVYVLNREPEPETTYALIVSGETKDVDGLKLGNDYKLFFTVDIPYLNIFSITANNGNVISNFNTVHNIIQFPISPVTDDLSFSIWFSLPFGIEEKQNVPLKISITPFFPGILPPVALQYVNWISDDRLFLRWEGITAGNNEIPYYYKITIPGGRSGISSEKGIFLKEDITFYLEAVR